MGLEEVFGMRKGLRLSLKGCEKDRWPLKKLSNVHLEKPTAFLDGWLAPYIIKQKNARFRELAL